MIKNKLNFAFLLLLITVLIACSSSGSESEPDPDPNPTPTPEPQIDPVKADIDTTITDITEAFSTIHESIGYDIISIEQAQNQQSSVKIIPDPGTNITLASISGDYNYMPATAILENGIYVYPSIFTRTTDSDQFILRLPREKALEPWNLNRQEEGDDQLANNFTITTTEYNFVQNETNGLNYTLRTGINVDNSSAGSMYIRSIRDIDENNNYDARYEFSDSYEGRILYITNDTQITHEFHLLENDETLYKEQIVVQVSNDPTNASFEIRITFNNIDIRKASDSTTYTVFRNGSEEEDVSIEVIGTCDNLQNAGFCRNSLDMNITFADGSTLNPASELGDETLDKMEDVFDAMYQIYFVQNIIDRVAIDLAASGN